MMGSDARDMMGLPSAASPKPSQPKIPKPKIRGPTGMSREVMDLNYEGAPPISIVAPKFKEKPKLPFKPRAWDETPFGNSARKDGLILKHWRRKGDAVNVGQLPVTPADSNAASEMDQDDKGQTIPDAHWAKYNVRIPRPQYSDEEYEAHLKSEDWSKEETDYLVDLAIDFDLRWIVISDRYDYHPPKTPNEEEGSVTTTPATSKSRSQEDMKSRYYTVAAKSMSLHVGVQNMSAVEFEMHEKMLKFSPSQETKRKAYVEQLLARSEEEKHEEEFLLKELSRIVINQEKLNNERKALYDRIDAPKTTQNDNYSTTMYQTSQGLTQLVQNMLSQNKQKDAQRKEKRQSGVPDEQDRHRTTQAEHNKRASVGGGAQAAHQHRHLNPRDQARYGVTYPVNERLVGGVTFRNERAVKAAQAKSSVQTTRISAALTELGVPVRLTMPTARVVSEYERLIENVKGLLEIRKLREKIDGEVRVWQAQKEAAEARERGEEVEEKKEEPKIEEEEEDNLEEEAKKKEDSDDDEEGQGGAPNQNEEEDEEENGQAGGRQSEGANNDEEEVEAGAEAEVEDNTVVGKEEDEDQEEDEEGDDEDDAGGEEDDAEDDEQVFPADVIGLDTAGHEEGGEDGEDGEDDAEEEEGEEGEEEDEEEGEEGDDAEAEAEGENEEIEENDDEHGPAPTARSTRKRSASVASGISSKRQKK